MFRIRNLLWDSDPLALHCPGPLHASWYRVRQTIAAFTPQQSSSASDITFITWHGPSRQEKPNGVFEESLARFGIKPLVLKKPDNWRNIDKLALTAEALESIDTPYVMGSDSSDTLIFQDPALLVERFESHFTCDLVYNAVGSRCWPELPEYIDYQSSLPAAVNAQGRHWFNSGMFFGRTEFCREYFRALSTEKPVPGYSYSEQAVAMRVWPQWYPRVQLDYQCLLFQWFNESLDVMRLERPAQSRHESLIEILRTLGSDLTGAEVGVFDGWTAEVLLRTFPDLRLWLVDAWQPYGGESHMGKQDRAYFQRAFEETMFWTKFAEDRRFTLREWSPQAADRFQAASLDFVFIDANHLYEAVRDDINAWWPKVRPGGALCGHDYAIHRDGEGVWGVQRAVDEFAKAQGLQPTILQDGVWCIYRQNN
ncbi:class I SAM-dependent methyltransferase [Bremerella sp. P1]|uniref:class I SAM-dependent methyltransferase n=1 Tax=Bremerella sp. P1 TaxID=3026424 RepID=UPI0023674676|nr:class I SAM-dependent methyltransferase [Bremerella sp. P1]WDI40598.1 class I SAM-dependent methyltransferase [Bremerella sp. P1]